MLKNGNVHDRIIVENFALRLSKAERRCPDLKSRKLLAVLACALIFVLALSACGQKFNSEELTASEQAAKAVVESIKFSSGEELKEVSVLQADDIAAALGNEVDISGWDISEARFAVILRTGSKTASADSTSESTDNSAVSDSTPKTRTAVALVGADNKVLYCSYTRSSVSESSSSVSATYDYTDGDSAAQDARYELAQKTIAVEEYEKKNSEKVGEFNAAISEKLAADPNYHYTTEYINKAEEMKVSDYADLLEEVRVAEHIVEIYEQAEGGTATMNASDAANTAKVWESLEEQRWELLEDWAEVQHDFDALREKYADDVAAFESKIEAFKKDDAEYMYSVDYLKVCLSSEVYNNYDVYTRQIDIYSECIDNLVECMELSDTNEISYKCGLVSTMQESEIAYVNALKTYVQCIINKDKFESENKAALAAYDSALAAAKEKSGDDYAKDMDFIKADVQYGELVTQRDAHTSAVENSKADADKVKAEGEEKAAKLEEEFAAEKKAIAEKLAQANLLTYCTELKVEASEYDVESGQWGMLPQEYLDYQNPLISYYVASSGSSYSGSKKNYSSGSSGSSGKTGAGGYDMPNSSDKSFSDYVKRVDPDLYDSMVGRYGSLD